PDAGKKTVAYLFARMLLCDRQGGDTCSDCRRVDEDAHPHFFPVAVREGKQNISIRQIAELRRSLALRPARKKPRVIVIDDAELLSEEAMNAMLKTLEEPPQDSVFVLVTATPAALLPTIRSRCQTVRFGPVPEDRVRKHLESTGWDAREAALAARMTGGRIGRALEGAEAVAAARAKLEETLGRILESDVNAVVESLMKIRDPKESRREAILLLDLLLLALREALRARIEERAPDPDLVPENAVRTLASLEEDEITRRMEILLDHRHFLDQNASVGLAVENALLRI
ncbi:MAG: DNA polymerase III subunit, partial [Planctomycetota bacterium]